jgi:hypothetical protein
MHDLGVGQPAGQALVAGVGEGGLGGVEVAAIGGGEGGAIEADIILGQRLKRWPRAWAPKAATRQNTKAEKTARGRARSCNAFPRPSPERLPDASRSNWSSNV